VVKIDVEGAELLRGNGFTLRLEEEPDGIVERIPAGTRSVVAVCADQPVASAK
jgi:hypothetical protein